MSVRFKRDGFWPIEENGAKTFKPKNVFAFPYSIGYQCEAIFSTNLEQHWMIAITLFLFLFFFLKKN